MRRILLTAIIAASFTSGYSQWTNLFDGRSLNGWVRRGGEAPYKVENGCIVGTSVLFTDNTFLCTEKHYADFILELEMKVDDKLNSGVQIRSNSYPDYMNGRVHGYQVECDPDPVRARFWSGGIYDEARRKWLYDLENNEAGRKSFKNGEWNLYRIEAYGDTIRTWINGIPTAYIIDNMTPSGFIGLQVHGIGKDSAKLNTQVMWRNIRIITDAKAIEKNKTQSPLTPKTYLYNKLSDQEKAKGWQLLFDGVSSSGWRGAYKNSFPEQGWIIRDQMLTVLKSGGAESRNGGDIVTINQYKDFHLKFDFMLTDSANSGVKYFVTLNEKNNQGSAFGCEFQILDDARHPDARAGRDGNRTIGSLYDLITADTSKVVKKNGEWNSGEIISRGSHVEHWLNGKKIVEYERGSETFRKLVAMSKYADTKYNINGRFGEAPQGHLLLQDHGDRVSFTNIKIKKF